MRLLSILSIALTIVSASADEPFRYATLTQGNPSLELKEGETALVVFKTGNSLKQLIYTPLNGVKVYISLLPTAPGRAESSEASASSDSPLPLAGPATLSVTKSKSNQAAFGLKIVKTNQDQSATLQSPPIGQVWNSWKSVPPRFVPAPLIEKIKPVRPGKSRVVDQPSDQSSYVGDLAPDHPGRFPPGLPAEPVAEDAEEAAGEETPKKP